MERDNKEDQEQEVADKEGGEEPTGIKCQFYPPAEADYQQLVENAHLFSLKLLSFHSSFTSSHCDTNFMSPSVGGTALDLHRLFVEVTSRGGLHQVIRDRKWEEVNSALKLPRSSISRSFLLRKYYVSLLYHFEQVYYFRKSVQRFPNPEAGTKIPGIRSTAESTTENFEYTTAIHVPASRQLQPGVSLVGIIDEKFDNGYVVSINMGSDQLKGILYHIPDRPQLSWRPTPCLPQRRKRKKSCLTLLDPSKAKTTRSSYNMFPEHYATLIPMSQGQEEWTSKKIGHLCNNLSETEKQINQDKE